MADLISDVRFIKGIGEQRVKALAKLGIMTLGDLISCFPRAYEDRSVFREISSVLPGESACIRAVVADTPRLSRIRAGLDLVKFRIFDSSGSIDVTYFNQNYIRNSIKRGEEYVFFGRLGGTLLRRELTNPIFERADSPGTVTGRIVPIYRLTAGISQNVLMRSVEAGLAACLDILPDPLPDAVRKKYSLSHVRYAYENIHFPENEEALSIARKRLIFEELYVLSCALRMFKGTRVRHAGTVLQSSDTGEFYSALPFTLTQAQLRSIGEAVSDMRSGHPMNRLLQGDVGSGKTAVAAACIWYTFKSGLQSAFMAPTEILAEQHFKTLSELLSPFGVSVDLLTGRQTAKQKGEICQRLVSGETNLVIGTHALITPNVKFNNLALVVTDEQHRFGVEQRALLTEKGSRPHVLVMSATPIPRTLALIIYGDLDISVIDELPPGRQAVETYAVDESKRTRIMNFARKQVEEGRQVFIICPLVEEGETASADLKSVQEYSEKLKRDVFPDLRVSLIHGKMKPKEKESVMSSFASGETDILVATTIVEVGIDVPNASLIIIENAERFGLGQLHQLRGRVGRGKHRSYCILISDSKDGNAKARLDIMCKTQSGFLIAEEDLKIRGPGDFFGSRQHGLPEMHIADLSYDMDILRQAQNASISTLEEDPSLSSPDNRKLRERIGELFSKSAGYFN